MATKYLTIFQRCSLFGKTNHTKIFKSAEKSTANYLHSCFHFYLEQMKSFSFSTDLVFRIIKVNLLLFQFLALIFNFLWSMSLKMATFASTNQRGNGARTSPSFMMQRGDPRPMTYAADCSHSWYDNIRCGTPQQIGSSCSSERQMMNMSLMEGEARRSSNNYIPSMSQRNLIVNYLPQAFTDRQLFSLFVPFGPLQSVKIMKEFKSGYSYGFGFVNYIREEDALKAIDELNGYQIENKRLKVSVARPPSDDIKDTNVYITNLPRSYTENELVILFGVFGDIVQKHVLRDKHTNLSRGSAFVRFDLREQASRAIITMNGYIPEGSGDPLRVKLAQDHGKQKAAYLAGFQDAWYRRRPPPRNFDI